MQEILKEREKESEADRKGMKMTPFKLDVEMRQVGPGSPMR